MTGFYLHTINDEGEPEAAHAPNFVYAPTYTLRAEQHANKADLPGGWEWHDDVHAWAQPQGAHDAYPEGWPVTHNGKIWVSLIPANVQEPGPGSRWWEAVAEEGAPTPGWAVGTYYKVGNTVTYEGGEWECTHEHLGQAGWEPSNPGMHAVWKQIN